MAQFIRSLLQIGAALSPPHSKRRAPRLSPLPVNQFNPDKPICLHDPIGSLTAAVDFLEGVVRPGGIGFEYDCMHIFRAFHVYDSLLRIIVDAVELWSAAGIKVPLRRASIMASRSRAGAFTIVNAFVCSPS